MPEQKLFTSVSDLIGKVSTTSDLKIQHHRSRYLQTTSVGANAYVRMPVARLGSNQLLDCRNIRMRFTLALTSTDAGICVANNSVFPFQRVRIMSGTKCVLDIDNAALLMSILYNVNQDVAISSYEQSVTGDSFNLATKQAWSDNAKEYIIPLYPDSTFLRGDRLLDVYNSSDLVLEFWTLSNSQYLYSPANDTTAKYSLSNIEILSQYIQSDGLAAHFRANPMAFTCQNYIYRYGTASIAVGLFAVRGANVCLLGMPEGVRTLAY